VIRRGGIHVRGNALFPTPDVARADDERHLRSTRDKVDQHVCKILKNVRGENSVVVVQRFPLILISTLL
jgi:hypothetical protein